MGVELSDIAVGYFDTAVELSDAIEYFDDG